MPRRLGAACLGLALLAACPSRGGTSGAGRAPTAPAPVDPARPVDAAVPTTPAGAAPPYRLEPGSAAGIVAGRVELAVPRPPVVASRATACGLRPGPFTAVSVDVTGGVGGALVWLEDIGRGKAPPPAGDEVVLAVRDCELRPAIVLLPRLDAPLAIVNEDPIRHELALRWASPPGAASAPQELGAAIPMPLEGQRFVLAPGRPGTLTVRCTLHAGEVAHVMVPPHPYHAQSGADGSFRIEGIPTGRYRLVAWHPPVAEGQAPLTAEAAVELAPDAGGAEVSLGLR